MPDPQDKDMTRVLRVPFALMLTGLCVLPLLLWALPAPEAVERVVAVVSISLLVGGGAWGGYRIYAGWHHHYVTCTRPVVDCRDCYEYQGELRAPLTFDEQRMVRERAARTMPRIETEDHHG